MSTSLLISPDVLKIDGAAEIDRIAASIRETVLRQCRRKGAVVAVSGGIDSSVVAALCVRALGPERVIALFLPETDSSGESLRLGKELAASLGIRSFTEDIAPILSAAGCYRRRDEAIRSVVPEYGDGYKSKIALPDLISADRYALFNLIVQSPSGEAKKVRLPLDAYLGIVAATNFKQRTRTMMAYYYADRFHYAVAGTPNRLSTIRASSSKVAMDWLISSRSPIFTSRRSINWRLNLACPKEFRNGRQPPIPTRWNNRRKNFIFRCRWRRWICASTAKTTLFLPRTWGRPLDSRRSRWPASTT